MDRQQEYRHLMERIACAHDDFSKAWSAARTVALEGSRPQGATSSEQLWQANGIAYKAAEPLSRRRNGLLELLFAQHLVPLREALSRGVPDAVDAIIDFLEVDVVAFRCGYAKAHYLRDLKTIPLTEQHCERLRQYGIGLCRLPHYRREIQEAGRLMIRVADKLFIEELQALTCSEDKFVTKKAVWMLGVVLNGRKDLRAERHAQPQKTR